jgi:hypothetical protein
MGEFLLFPSGLDRLTRRIAAEHPDLDDGLPPRILDQAVAFLGTSATATQPIGPSELVDIGWHTFILYTVDYAPFCERVAGRFIHVVGNLVAPREGQPGDRDALPANAAAGSSRLKSNFSRPERLLRI